MPGLAGRIFRVEERVQGIDGSLKWLAEQTFRVIDELEKLRTVVEQGFSAVNARLDRIDERLAGHDARLDRIDARLDGIDGHLVDIKATLRLIQDQLLPPGAGSP